MFTFFPWNARGILKAVIEEVVYLLYTFVEPQLAEQAEPYVEPESTPTRFAAGTHPKKEVDDVSRKRNLSIEKRVPGT